MYNAGVKIVHSIWDGMKSVWASMMNWFIDGMNKIGKYVPFYGSDIKRVDFSKTIEISAAISSARTALSPVNPVGPAALNPVRSGDMHFSSTAYVSGTATSKDAARVTTAQETSFKKMMKDYQAYQSRVSFAEG